MLCHESRTQAPSRCFHPARHPQLMFSDVLLWLHDEPHTLKEIYNEYS
jgi:hypothetical protein